MVALALPNNLQGLINFFYKKAFWNTRKNVTLRLALWSLNFVASVWTKSSIFIQFLMLDISIIQYIVGLDFFKIMNIFLFLKEKVTLILCHFETRSMIAL